MEVLKIIFTFLLYYPPTLSLSGLVGHVKAYSSKWSKHKTGNSSFTWQNGYLAISTQEDRINHVCAYIRSDKDRHQSKSYSEELKEMLKQQNIEYKEEYFLRSSHSKVYVHIIWSTYNRIPYLDKHLREALYDQIKINVSRCKGIVHEIGGIEDHIHLLIEAPRDMALSDLIRETKTTATHWLKNQDKVRFRDFEWQTGYGAFTVSLTSFKAIKQYIQQQEEHHRKKTFQEEWDDLLKRVSK